MVNCCWRAVSTEVSKGSGPTKCLCVWSHAPGCLSRCKACLPPLGNGNACCTSPQGITVHYISTDTHGILETDYNHTTSGSANLSRPLRLWERNKWEHFVHSEMMSVLFTWSQSQQAGMLFQVTKAKREETSSLYCIHFFHS